MSSPSIIQGFSLDMAAPLLFAFLTAWFFWRNVVPRQLKGLQVAFPTGQKTYEVHKVTSSVDDVRRLLARRGTRLGVTSYLMALMGSLVLLFEFFNFRSGGSAGYHSPSVAFALILIVVPAVVSSGTSLGAQVIKPLGVSRATLQSNSNTRNASYVALTIAWLLLALAIGEVLDGMGTSKTTRYECRSHGGVQPRRVSVWTYFGFVMECPQAILFTNRQRWCVAVPQSSSKRTSTIHRSGRSSQLGRHALRRRQHPDFADGSGVQS